MHGPHGIVLTDPDDLELDCAYCANRLTPGALRARQCSICHQTCDVDGRGLADAKAIVNLRRLLASRIDGLDAALLELVELARPPLWNLTLISIHLMSRLEQWQASQAGERATIARCMRWEAPLQAPLYAERAALHEQRLIHALLAWSADLAIRAFGKDNTAEMKRGTIAFAITVSAIVLFSEIFAEYVPQTYSWVLGLLVCGIMACSILAATLPTTISTIREVLRPPGLGHRLHRELSAVDLRCDRRQLRGSAMRWLQARWAGELDRDDFDRGEAMMTIRGGVDAQGEPSEALAFIRGGAACNDVVVYLPMVDVRGAIEEPAEITRTGAKRLLAALRRRSWSIKEESAGIYATRFIDGADALTSADWRRLADDISGLLELPAGLGLLSTRTARARLAAAGVANF